MLALTILLPASMCMGGTLPVLGDAVVRDPARLGRWGGLVYGWNTAGAMLGGIAAGFWLPVSLGVQQSYWLAVGINLMVGVGAWALSRQPRFRPLPRPLECGSVDAARDAAPGANRRAGLGLGGDPDSSPMIWRAGLVIAGASGFCLLGLEVLWTRMFAQVLQNSVYSYAAIVVTVLAGLALSAFLISLSSRYGPASATTVITTVCLAGAATLATPFLFHLGTGGLQYQWTSESWNGYLAKLFGLVAIVIGPAVVLGGMVLPMIWRLGESGSERPGSVVGRTAAVNTFSAVLGALVSGFVLLPAMGLWRSIFVLGAVWFLAAAVGSLWFWRRSLSRSAVLAALGGLVTAGALIIWPSAPGGLPLVRLDASLGEQLVEVREGSHGIVAVVDQPQLRDRRLKVDNFYTLGGVAAREEALLQGQLPLLLHPAPKRVLYIGSATGISPSGALSFPVEQIVTVEVIPEVIELARRHFHDANRGVYDDPRVRAVAADGRNFLLRTPDSFDVIIADLFIPWHAGTGSMYSLEQFTLAASRLSPGGLFCQWLPLYQLSPEEFRLIAATFLQAFPHTTLWRGDFSADRPIIALVGHQSGHAVELERLEGRLALLRQEREVSQRLFRDVAGILMLYAGNLSQAGQRFADLPINTDNRPLLEYLAPRIGSSNREEPVGAKQWFVGQSLAAFYRQLHEEVLALEDPLFPGQTLAHREYRMAGELFYSFNVMAALGQHELAGKALEQAVDLLPESLSPGPVEGERP
jgi:spermidine synthase